MVHGRVRDGYRRVSSEGVLGGLGVNSESYDDWACGGVVVVAGDVLGEHVVGDGVLQVRA